MTIRRPAPLIGLLTSVVLAACGTASTGTDTISVATSSGPASTTSTSEAVTETDTGADADTVTDPGGGNPTTASRPDLDAVAIEFSEIGVFDRPVDLAVRPGDAALYIAEQAGRIWRVNGSTTEMVADLSALTVGEGEKGLLGLAFSPSGDRAYVNYTDLAGDTVIAEYRISDGGVVDPTSSRFLMQIPQPYGNHNGGGLVVDGDGHLLIGLGDGGAAGDPARRALDPNDLLGKILRIDPEPDDETGLAYRIPPDNPYADGVGGRPEILISGVRNPWKLSIDPATGDLWVADVGQDSVEEATRLSADEVAGASLGWGAFEGDQRFNEDQPAEGHLPPTLTYRHGDLGCSISGGAVYRGRAISALVGAYVFGDFCSGRVMAVDPESGRSIELARVSPVSAVLPGPDGEMHVASYEGEVWRLIPADGT